MEHKSSDLNNTMNKRLDAMDWISELPEFIIHHILSFLPVKDATQTSVLSKKWEHIWASFPILDFDQVCFNKSLTRMNSRRNKLQYPELWEALEKFMNFVDCSLVKFCEQKFSIQKFKLHITLADSSLASLIDKWIGLALEKEVNELDLNFRTEPETFYSLPHTIFATKSITILKLRSCKLEQASSRDSAQFSSLQRLFLSRVHVNEQIIQNLISSCRLIEYFSLKYSWGLKRFQVFGLHKLKVVELYPRPEEQLEIIDIEAPSLRCFYFSNSSPTMPCMFNMAACQNLELIYLEHVTMMDSFFHNLISKFPLLQYVHVRDCDMLEKVKISSHCLKSFSSHWCDKLVEVEIDTPILHSFSYRADRMPLLSFTKSPCESEVMLRLSDNKHLDTLWFLKLREFLAKLNQNNIFALSLEFEESAFNLEEIREISLPPLYELKQFQLSLQSSSLNYAAIVDGLLWCCRPKNLLVVRVEHCDNFIKFLWEKLLNREDPHCCNSSHIQCWRHYLKDVKIVTNEGEEGEKSLHLNTLLDALETGEEIFDFRLKW